MDKFIVADKKGNQLLEMIWGDEDEVLSNETYRPLTGSLVVVKGPAGFMLLKNRFRNVWEIAGGMIEPGETPRQCATRECQEESGYTIDNLRFAGLMKCFLVAGYFSAESRIEYTALYCADVREIQAFQENDEMIGLRWHVPGDPIEDANEIDIKLLEYYF
jgi:8-oxo-dGTP diphosphatase